MKKILILLIVLFSSVQIFAIPRAPCQKHKVCCKKPPPGPFAFTYNKEGETPCAKNIYVNADFLYLNYGENFEYAYVIDNQIKTDDKPNNYRPGFRINFNYLYRKKFYFNAKWTYIRFKSESSVYFFPSKVLGSLLPPDDLNIMSSASARHSGNLNTLDLNLIKSYYVGRHFISNPAIGLRAAWINQYFLARYFPVNLKNTVGCKNDFWGVGIATSYEALFQFHKYVKVYVDTLFSLLFGKFDVVQQSNAYNSLLTYSIEDSYYTVRPNTEISLGFLFSKFFEKRKYKVSLKVGWEFHYWWDQNQLKKPLDTNPVAVKNFSNNDLSFYGPAFGLIVNF